MQLSGSQSQADTCAAVDVSPDRISGKGEKGAGAGDLVLDLAGLERLFGAGPGSLDRIYRDCLGTRPLLYKPLDKGQRDSLLLEIVGAILSEGLETCGSHRLQQWEKGWSCNLERFVASGWELDALVPGYYKAMAPFRYERELYMATSHHLVRKVTEVFRSWLFERFFSNVDEIFEFGCGSGFHLARLASLFPEKKIYGFDWTDASCQIADLLREKKGLRVRGGYFDFYRPDHALPLGPCAGVLTFGALEQVGNNFEPFLRFLVRKKPAVCVHVECIAEFYDPEILLDYLALAYHRRRNYLEGFWPALKKLEAKGVLEIMAHHHQRFGNIYNDSHSYVVWRPAG